MTSESRRRSVYIFLILDISVNLFLFYLLLIKHWWISVARAVDVLNKLKKMFAVFDFPLSKNRNIINN